MGTNGHHGHQKHHPTHLLSPHKYFLYALSEQQRLLFLLAVNTRGLDYSALWILCWVLQIYCVHIGDHIGDRAADTTLGTVDFHEISCSFAARVKTGPRVKSLV